MDEDDEYDCGGGEGGLIFAKDILYQDVEIDWGGAPSSDEEAAPTPTTYYDCRSGRTYRWEGPSSRHQKAGWRNAGGYTATPGCGRRPTENARKKAQKAKKLAQGKFKDEER